MAAWESPTIAKPTLLRNLSARDLAAFRCDLDQPSDIRVSVPGSPPGHPNELS
jgi:hypothetical protein